MEEILFQRGEEITFLLEPEAFPGVRRVAEKVAADFERVCRTKTRIVSGAGGEETVIFAATVGHSALLEKLEQEGKICLKEVKGRWEVFRLECAEEPFEGVKRALVVAGSDKRGTIYGLFELSEMIGVTPFLYFGDVNPGTFERIAFQYAGDENREETDGSGARQEMPDAQQGGTCMAGTLPFTSKEPSVKFRGFFINDEWPCFGNWTFSHFGGFNAEMYDHVFEFLLRMKGNYLWPAMWSSSFFLDGPGMKSMDLADEYGVIIGNSHHEPCMRASEEWDKVKGKDTPYGTEWNYKTNREGLLNYWADGLKRSAGHEKFITIGMRGERDSALEGPSTLAENIEVLKDIIREQKRLIREYVSPDLDRVPMLLAVYKEVEDYYYGDKDTPGLKDWDGLDGVTVMLCEDNFGNMRFLPDADHRERNGGYGMYYHLDYHGGPVSYEWVGSTPLTRTWEQMTQAWEYGVRQMWIVNVGDLKFEEFFLGYFMKLAYDFETWGSAAPNTTGRYTREFVDAQFPQAEEALRLRIGKVIEEYVRLNGLRRPEALNDEVYHPAYDLEGKRMLQRAVRLGRENEEILRLLPEECRDAYRSMVWYPAAGTANLLQMHLYAGLNHLYARQGKTAANVMGQRLQECIRKDRELAEEFARSLDGKWSGMEQAEHIGFTKWNSENWKYPVRCVVEPKPAPYLLVSRADETKVHSNDYFFDDVMIRDFMYPGRTEVPVEIANGGQGELSWHLEGGCDWIETSAVQGKTATQETVVIRFLPERFSGEPQKDRPCELFVCTGKEKVRILVYAKETDRKLEPGIFVEGENGFVIDASHFRQKTDGEWNGRPAGYLTLQDYGKYGTAVKVFPVTAEFPDVKKAPSLEYRLFTENAGDYILEVHSAPGNPVDEGRGLVFAYSVNGQEARRVDTIPPGYHAGDTECGYWCQGVLNQVHRCRIRVRLQKGINELRIFAVDASLVLERLLLCPEGRKISGSYLGAQESFRTGD